MSRSHLKNPFFGFTTAVSEKQDKREANRRLRRKVRAGKCYLTLREVSNVWSFAKDGKRYLPNCPAAYKRK